MNKTLRILGKRGRITIPYEIRQRVGFGYNDVLSFTETENGHAVIVKREKICDHCRETSSGIKNGEVTLLDFLNSLTESEQRAALVHLSVKLDEKPEVN